MITKTLAVTFCICAPLAGQGIELFPQTLNRSDFPSPSNPPSVADVATGDLNGDGIEDLVFAGFPHGGILLQGKDQPLSSNFQGSGRFFDVSASMGPGSPNLFGLISRAVAIADLDEDGDNDVIVCTDNVGLEIVPLFNSLNAGQTQLQAGAPLTTGAPMDAVEAIAVGDVDGDGDADLAVVTNALFPQPPRSPTQPLLFLNDGSGTFTNATPTNIPVDPQTTGTATQSDIAMADINGDGFLDIIVSRFNGLTTADPSLLLLNAGSTNPGQFINSTNLIGSQTDYTSSIVAGDVDDDGDLDIVFGVTGTPTSFLMRQGPGLSFTRETIAPITATGQSAITTQTAIFQMDVRLLDFDEDCDLDLIVNHNDPTERTQLLENDGAGNWTEVPNLIFDETAGAGGGAWHTAMEVADIDGDGDLDAILGSDNPLTPAIEIRYNRFRELDAPRTIQDGSSLALEVSSAPGLGAIQLLNSFVIIDLTARSNFLQIPGLTRGPCQLPTGDLLGLTPFAQLIDILIPPYQSVLTIPLPSGFVGTTVYFQCASVRFGVSSPEFFLGAVTATEIVP
ncbi:MAG: VCBS repeat-containing protein [Planctomycetota bacterium]|nr:VCBS repeat-containing protein [Planctomycetota bacterium]